MTIYVSYFHTLTASRTRTYYHLRPVCCCWCVFFFFLAFCYFVAFRLPAPPRRLHARTSLSTFRVKRRIANNWVPIRHCSSDSPPATTRARVTINPCTRLLARWNKTKNVRPFLAAKNPVFLPLTPRRPCTTQLLSLENNSNVVTHSRAGTVCWTLNREKPRYSHTVHTVIASCRIYYGVFVRFTFV